MVSIYFLDTYALIEIIKNNKNFERFKDSSNFTGLMNLLELHYYISKEFIKERADLILDKLKSIIIDFNLNDIKLASRFRIEHIKKGLSFIDSLSYAMAKNRNFKFVTGDNAFKNLDNIEFVK